MLKRWFSSGQRAWALLALAVLSSFGVAWAISLAIPLPADDDFNVVRWELRNVSGKWLDMVSHSFSGGLSREEEDERLGRFLTISRRIRSLERRLALEDESQLEELAQLRKEWNGLENDAERIIEGRVTAILEEAGLESSFPLFPDLHWVFPPVDFEFDEPLRVLTVSPRDRIFRIDRQPLRQGLTIEEVARREAAEEVGGERSALAETVGGAATYPSIVAAQVDYERLAEIVAHEWVHQFLFFRPLGSRYFESQELTTLNETVANSAGRELAAHLVERFSPPPTLMPEQNGAAPRTVDVGAVLRQLRIDVEELLSRGEIEAAEMLMEQRRLELAEGGVFFRRINQAFFASRAVYADTPASIDPIGPLVQALRDRTGSVGEFLHAAADLTSAADLERLLAGRP